MAVAASKPMTAAKEAELALLKSANIALRGFARQEIPGILPDNEMQRRAYLTAYDEEEGHVARSPQLPPDPIVIFWRYGGSGPGILGSSKNEFYGARSPGGTRIQ